MTGMLGVRGPGTPDVPPPPEPPPELPPAAFGAGVVLVCATGLALARATGVAIGAGVSAARLSSLLTGVEGV